MLILHSYTVHYANILLFEIAFINPKINCN
jgi:hypothetical protein